MMNASAAQSSGSDLIKFLVGWSESSKVFKVMGGWIGQLRSGQHSQAIQLGRIVRRMGTAIRRMHQQVRGSERNRR